MLENSLGAQGKGLHEKCTSVQHLISKVRRDLLRGHRWLPAHGGTSCGVEA